MSKKENTVAFEFIMCINKNAVNVPLSNLSD